MRFFEKFHFLVFLFCLIGKLMLAAMLGFKAFQQIIFGRRRVQFFLLFVYHEDVEVLSFLEVQLNLFSLELMKLLLVTAPQVSPSFDKYQLKNEAFERNVGLLRGGCLPSLEIGNNTHWRPNRHRRQVFVPWNLMIARNMLAHQVIPYKHT
nr:uncharacterized protein LOC104645760 [Solanum lycopersicum]